MNPLISVIVPIYNVEEFLPDCIDSLIKQTYTNIEIILVNDGTIDNSGQLSDEYACKDKRIKVIHKENGGLSDARNAGLDACTGEFIAFVDSDDFVHVDYIHHLYTIIGDADVAVCSFEDFEQIQSITDLSKLEILTKYDKHTYLQSLASIDETNLVVAWNKLYKRELWDDLRYIKGVIHEDEFIIHHIVNLCTSIVLSNLKLYYYRHRPNSITSLRKNKKSYLDKLDAFYDRYLFYKRLGMSVEERKMLSILLDRCARPTVDKHNNVFQHVVHLRTIFSAYSLTIQLKVALLMKLFAYPVYLKLFRRD